MTGRLQPQVPSGLSKRLVTIDDSQGAYFPFYTGRPDQKWPCRLREMLDPSPSRKIRERNYGIGGRTTADALVMCDIMQKWEVPDIAAIYLGVNDGTSQPYPVATPSSTGGSITATSGSQYVGISYVAVGTSGQRLAFLTQAVQVPVGTTGSISVGATTLGPNIAQIDVYLTPITYATAAAATAAASRSYLFSVTPAVSSGSTAATTITALPSGTARLPSVSTQANTQALIKALKYRVTGFGLGTATNWVAGQANLPANAPIGSRLIVMDDTSATGGIAPLPYTSQRARIAGDFSGPLAAQQSVWECRMPRVGELGWGRVAVTGTPVFAGGCARFLVISTNYLNWTTGGDNVNVATGKAFTAGTSADSTSPGVYFSTFQGVRAQTLAAVNAENVNDNCCLYVDLFGFMSGLIAAGETTQGSNSWHDQTNNQHHEIYGHDIVARACHVALNTSRPAWLTALAI